MVRVVGWVELRKGGGGVPPPCLVASLATACAPAPVRLAARPCPPCSLGRPPRASRAARGRPSTSFSTAATTRRRLGSRAMGGAFGGLVVRVGESEARSRAAETDIVTGESDEESPDSCSPRPRRPRPARAGQNPPPLPCLALSPLHSCHSVPVPVVLAAATCCTGQIERRLLCWREAEVSRHARSSPRSSQTDEGRAASVTRSTLLYGIEDGPGGIWRRRPSTCDRFGKGARPASCGRRVHLPFAFGCGPV